MYNCNRKHVSGMEEKHEVWVNATIKLLHDLNVQTYKGGWNANSIAGMNLPKGPVMDVDERLNLLRETIMSERASAAAVRIELNEEKEKFLTKEKEQMNTRDHLNDAEDMMEEFWLAFTDGEAPLSRDDFANKLGKLADLGEFLKKRRPHLFQEEKTNVDTSS